MSSNKANSGPPDHQWTYKGQHTTIVDETENTMFNTAPFLAAAEAERLVEDLQKYSVEDVGSEKWMLQHEVLEKLNMQAHQCAMSNSDEFVLESILVFDKLDTIIHDLIVTEAWVENVYPKLLDRLAEKNSMRMYFILYHQATLVNLLEVLLYHKHVCEAGGEMMIELVDYVARKLGRLNGGYNFSVHDPADMLKGGSGGDVSASSAAFNDAVGKRTPAEELTAHLTQIEFRACISAVSLGRLLCENVDSMPLSVATRISDTHDYLILMLPVIENPPWTRRKNGKWQKLIDFKWEEVAPIDLLKITKLEGQPWLAVYHLLSKKEFRERYQMNGFRKSQLLRIRKYINDVLLDQLPILADLQRYMDELSIAEGFDSQASSSSFGGGSMLMFQQVAIYREKLFKDKNWDKIADYQVISVFTMSDRNDPYLKRMADFYSDDAVESIMDPTSGEYPLEPEDVPTATVEEDAAAVEAIASAYSLHKDIDVSDAAAASFNIPTESVPENVEDFDELD